MQRFALIAGAALTVTACSLGANTAAGDKIVATFHQQLNAHDYDGILAEAGPEIKTDPHMRPIFALIDTRLGRVASSERTGFNDQINTAGHLLVLGYRTMFAKGVGQETFTFRIIDGRTELVGYDINAPALLDLSGRAVTPSGSGPTVSPSPSPSASR